MCFIVLPNWISSFAHDQQRLVQKIEVDRLPGAQDIPAEKQRMRPHGLRDQAPACYIIKQRLLS